MTTMTIVDVLVDQIMPNPWEPRQTMDPQGLEELADSIEREGLKQPIGLRPIRADLFERRWGQRRLDAWKMIMERRPDWPVAIPSIVEDVDDRQMMVDALVENQQREEVDPIEEARAMHKALGEIDGLSISSLAATLNIAPTTLSDRLRMLRLPERALKEISSGRMSWTAGRELLALTNGDHVHEEEIKGVLHRLRNEERYETIKGPDVRYAIRQTIENLGAKRWRPLVDIGKYSMSGAIAAAPQFDVEEFEEDHPDELHRIPKTRSTELWTCAAAAWMAKQREARKQMGIKPAPDSTRQYWAHKLAHDQVVRTLGITEDQLLHDDLTEEQRDKLGTRGIFQRGSVDDERAIEGSFRGAVPRFFDKNECINGCVSGAVYRPDWTGEIPKLKCQNFACYDRKMEEGLEKFKADVTLGEEHSQSRRNHILNALLPMLEVRPGLAKALLAVLLDRRVVTGAITDPLPERGDMRDMNYYSGTVLSLAAYLTPGNPEVNPVVELANQQRPLWVNDEVVADIDGLEDPVTAAALALSHALEAIGVKAEDLIEFEVDGSEFDIGLPIESAR